MKRFPIITLVLLCALLLPALSGEQVARALDSAPIVQPDAVGSTGNACQAILEKALKTTESSCKKVGRNKACYGNNSVKIEPNTGTLPQFNTIGDIVNIADIRSLTTAPLDEAAGVWGISLLKLQANLPDSLPGQNVTFLVVGNTHIDNTSGDMQTFYFSSGLGLPSCKEAPKDSIIVKSPQHVKVTFNANGTQITIASTVLLRAEKGKQMSVTLIEGRANVKNAHGSQDLKPGQQVTIPLGGVDGFTPSDAPSVPVTNPDANDRNITAIVNSANGLDRAGNVQNGIRPTRPPQASGGNGSGNANGNANGNAAGNANGNADGNAAGNANGGSGNGGSGNANGNSNGGGGNGGGNGNGN
jgi:hypothetical protein